MCVATCVDDFLIKYINNKDEQYLLDTLKKIYTISTDWEANTYCGVTLEWDYITRTCDLSMPGYGEKALQSINHSYPKRPQHSPYPWTQPQYRKAIQYAEEEDTADILAQDEVTHIQQVIGKFYYYARVVDHTMITSLGEMATTQRVGRATRKVADRIVWFFNYAGTHPTAKRRYHASGMILHVDSDAVKTILLDNLAC